MKLVDSLRRLSRERIGTYRVLFVSRLVQWPLRAASRPIIRRTRRDPHLVAFGGSGGRFADNAAYLFLHMTGATDLRCVWVSPSATTVAHLRSLGLDAVRRWSWEGVRVARRASWYVFTSYRGDINPWLSDGATAFNLWHGVGVKRIQRDRTSGPGSSAEGSLSARIFADDRRAPDWLLTSSPTMTKHFARAFDVPIERCLELGYPRNDFLAVGRPPDALVDRQVYERIEAARLVVGYFPTFRDDSISLPGGAPAVSEMSRIVGAQGATFLFKPHEATTLSGVEGEATIVLPKEADLNTYLHLCDVLITDYSSVAIDFLLLKRPIILYCPDLDEYRAARGFYFDPEEVLPGRMTRTRDELYAALADLSRLAVTEHDAELIDFWWSHPEPGASARIAAFIREHLADDDRRPGARADVSSRP